MPRSCRRSSTLRSESGKRTYSITAKRIISGLVLKYLNGERFVIWEFYKYTLLASTEFNLTVPVRVVPQPILTDFSRELWPKTFNPKPNCFVTDIDAAFMQDVFHLTKTQWITYVIHHCQSDDFRWSLEIFEGRTCCHLPKIGIDRETVKFVWQHLVN